MRRTATVCAAVVLIALSVFAERAQTPQPPRAPDAVVAMPNKDGSLKFAVLGDFGVGDKRQYDMAAQMVKTWKAFKFTLMITVGDNLYGSERPQDFRAKFETPYKELLDGGVKVQASLGNHDAREQRDYKPFNMGGKLFYSFKAPAQSVRFFALESTYPVPEQIVWFEKELKDSNDDWKIPYFHHPLYSSAGRHGSDASLRETLEPLLVQYNVSVVFSGHDHVYERTKPQKDITYFVTGSGGKLSAGDLDRRSTITAKGFDTDNAFLIAEIIGDQMTFNTVSRTGAIVDSGVITRRGIKK
ncbi:MAG TPA: metallophosphoesterase [Vicinamibacterales bacterium]|nr:metallophosphoesterase [Vicinamibacterales bacterium]